MLAYARAVLSPSRVIESAREALSAEPDLRWGYVFGSVARGEPYRDVDIAVMPAPTMAERAVAWGQLMARLEAAIGADVDLADLGRPNLPFVGPLLTERVVVLDRERAARIAWEAETTSHWLDFRPAWEAAERTRTRAMLRRVNKARS
jgi:predicted nucleotidyltransferase